MKKLPKTCFDDLVHEETGEELILRLEKECHCRVDSNSFDNPVIAGLIGHISRVLGKSNHNPHDDVVAGTVQMFQMSEAGRRKRQADQVIANLLAAGVSPDTLRGLVGDTSYPISGQAQGGSSPHDEKSKVKK